MKIIKGLRAFLKWLLDLPPPHEDDKTQKQAPDDKL